MIDMEMMRIYSWLNTSGENIAGFLIVESILATFLFCIILVLSRLLNRRFLHLQWYLWLLIPVRLVLPLQLSFHGKGWSWIVRHLPVRILFHRLLPGMDPRILSDGPDNAFSLHPAASTSLSGFPEALSFPDSTNASLTLFGILFTIWFSVVFSIFLVYLLRHFRYRYIVRNSSVQENDSILRITHKWKGLLGIQRAVRIISSESDHFTFPFTMGIIHPVVYLPQSLISSQNLNILESVIAHELSHIKRTDSLWNFLLRFIYTLFFFFPVIWIVRRRLATLQECLCDQMVIRHHQISPRQYGLSLVSFLNRKLSFENRSGFTNGFYRYMNQTRIRLIQLQGGKPMKPFVKILFPVLTIVSLVVLYPGTGSLKAGGETSSNPVSMTASSDIIQEKKSAPENARFITPLPGRSLSAGYGLFIHPVYKKEVFHKGVDIPAPSGTVILASASGTVLEAENDTTRHKGYGRYLLLSHPDEYQTFYAHLDTVTVSPGQKVSAGDAVGRVGDTGMSTGSHLHFEIRKSGKAVSPETLIDFKPKSEN
jgi:beta-lactamase regulating signal transducer with metallopeptidase domain